MGESRLAFVSREVYPFDSAGLGNYVLFSAAALAPHAEVTIITSSVHEERYRELVAARDPRLPESVGFEFIPEPEYPDDQYWYGALHLWSARAYEALKRIYPDGGPDLVEFPDYLGEGFVTAQAVQTRDRALRNTTVCIRAYTTAEMCAVLDGFVADDRLTRYIHELERYALRHADHFLWPGGRILSAYRSFYGEDAIAAPVEVRHPVVAGPPASAARDGDGRVKFLYVGRFERRKGVQNLIRAASALEGDDWALTLIGGDTPTAPLGTSMRAQLELMIAGDPRIELLGRVDREELRGRYAAADVCVSPSIWECWPNTVLEAFENNRRVLATPVGGHVGMVRDGDSGWLAAGTDADALGEAMRLILHEHRQSAADGEDDAPRRRFEELTDPEPVRERYIDLARSSPARHGNGRARRVGAPLVSVVVPYYEMDRYVAETLDSIHRQTYPSLEVVVVNDGSLRERDRVLEGLAERYPVSLVTQPNSGLGQARNLGVDVIRGRYVLPVDPDDVIDETFVERCVEVLEQRPELAYVTAWSEFIDEHGVPREGGYRPIGNTASWPDAENVTGSAMAVIRRRLFERGLRYSPDLTSYEDWLLYMEMRAIGAYGHVIPETLLRYRVRSSSMMRGITKSRRERLSGEFAAHLKEAAVRWT